MEFQIQLPKTFYSQPSCQVYMSSCFLWDHTTQGFMNLFLEMQFFQNWENLVDVFAEIGKNNKILEALRLFSE